jgi:Arc/MetJ-type ribon-helix-helix transcriptional regulator
MAETALKPKRRNLTLPDSSIARIAAIRERTEAASDSEVVRRALRLYESLLKAEATVQDKDGRSLPIGML